MNFSSNLEKLGKLETEEPQKQQANSRPEFNETEQVNSDGKNVNQIVCICCGSIILQKITATFQSDGPSKLLPLPFQKSKHNELPINLETEEYSKWWIVNNMFTFENVGFTHSFEGLKFLACADCEIGPIGFVCPDTNNCFVSVERL
ncbi:hypothetical protein Mgra_00000803 [Meloidogyne graminicola]|uniref:Guanine nucleotide exchange factor MSS4 n=1 Tax=Meloidogyne graminicola TaxID=189291 RepID=A0A8T0A2U3_9BILA|nr:hypothetical protein Mgra_00000803 [Meloidogyne graminicola]